MSTPSLIFDFYGTLVQITRPQPVFQEIRKVLASKGSSLKWLMTQEIESFTSLSEQLGISHEIAQNWDQEIKEEVASVSLFKEVPQVLEELSSTCDLFLLSNLATPYKLPFYQLGLDRWIRRAFFSCETGLLKPSPAAFTHLLQSLGKEPSEILMIGDSYRSDIVGAKESGIPAIWIKRKRAESPQSLPSLTGLKARIEKAQFL